ncbi:MAG TPA: VWA domain-containing protein [Leptolyngbyaceae cyanobacterium]
MTSSTPNQPRIELIPMHAALASNRSATVDVLIRILPPETQLTPDRPPLNLGVVIDRSGSMSGLKIEYAKKAACYAVENLLPSDRISLTLFDTRVETSIPNTLAVDKAKILTKIREIEVGSSTALHAGWVEGGIQVSHYLNPEHINRVVLLSDGLANVGETRPDAISSDVHGLSQRGISTSTLGVGNDYDEDLLEAMARSGDGNFYHIESPDQLPTIFENELMGLSATVGRQVQLWVNTQNGVVLKDVLNDFDTTDTGVYKLPNLVIGSPINVVVRLQIPALAQLSELCQFTLTWDEPKQPERQYLKTTLQIPLVNVEQLSDFPANPEVQEQLALLMAARARKEAIDRADQGDLAGASRSLKFAQSTLSAMPMSPAMVSEFDTLSDLTTGFDNGDVASTRKKALYQRYDLQRSRAYKRPQSPEVAPPKADS